MNHVILKGNCGGDPEVKTFDWGKVAKFSLATTETRKKKEEKVTETTWHNLVFFGTMCDVLQKYVHKGDQILIVGKIQNRQYEDKNKVTHWATEIVCDSFEFCGGNKKEEKPEVKSDKIPAKPSNINELPGNVADYDNIPEEKEIPF